MIWGIRLAGVFLDGLLEHGLYASFWTALRISDGFVVALAA